MEKKKLFYVLTAVMGTMILIIVIFAIISAVGGKRLSYDKIEDKMSSAAKNYFEDNVSSLPKEEGQSVTVDTSTLVNGKYLKQLSDMAKKGVDCTGKVIVTKNGDRYLYSPMLNCGSEYKTQKLIDVVTTNNPLVISGDGLYSYGEVSKFKGDYINNYVKIDNYLWRILDIDSEGYMRLIYADKQTKEMEETYVWDNRYNIDKDSNSGINNYEVSRIKETMKKLETETLYISDEFKVNLAYRPICVGKRSSTNVALNNNEECEVTISNQLFGLPYVSDYVSASTDANCIDIASESCKNYNYLMNSSLSSWTLNGQKEKSYRVFNVGKFGYSISDASSDKAIRPTIYLSNNALYESGNGTKKEPYVVK
ncbi:MAG: hypothetical protein E7165_01490 [Firmicutes bacterium]|nr:hypothetical protein [Bacillota bacterium]